MQVKELEVEDSSQAYIAERCAGKEVVKGCDKNVEPYERQDVPYCLALRQGYR